MSTFLFNNTDASFYRATFLKGTFTELQKPSKRKERYTKDWPDQSGTERDVANPTFESRSLSLPIMILGLTTYDFLTKQQAFFEWIKFAGYFTLTCLDINRSYKLLYSDISNYEALNDNACTFNLILIDDFPHIISVIS